MAFLNESIKIFQKIINKKFEIKWSTEKNEESSLVQDLRIPVNCNELRKRKYNFICYIFIDINRLLRISYFKDINSFNPIIALYI